MAGVGEDYWKLLEGVGRAAILYGKGRLSRVSAKGGKRTRIGPILRFYLLFPGVFSRRILIYCSIIKVKKLEGSW
jgi:hypothetical protein